MEIKITNEAVNWYKKELYLAKGDGVKFFGKVYGVNGFSIAIGKMPPSRPEVQTVVDEITFYVEKSDAWFFEGSNLVITYDEEMQEPKYELKN